MASTDHRLKSEWSARSMNLKRALSNIARTKNKIANSLTRKSLFVDIDLQQDHGETISDMPFAAEKFRYKSNAQYLPSLTTVLNQYTSGDYKGMKLFDPPPEDAVDEWPLGNHAHHAPQSTHTLRSTHAPHTTSDTTGTQPQSLLSKMFGAASPRSPSALASDLHSLGSRHSGGPGSSPRGAQGPAGGLAPVSSTAKLGLSGHGHGHGHGHAHGHSASALSVSSSGGILVETVVGGEEDQPLERTLLSSTAPRPRAVASAPLRQPISLRERINTKAKSPLVQEYFLSTVHAPPASKTIGTVMMTRTVPVNWCATGGSDTHHKRVVHKDLHEKITEDRKQAERDFRRASVDGRKKRYENARGVELKCAAVLHSDSATIGRYSLDLVRRQQQQRKTRGGKDVGPPPMDDIGADFQMGPVNDNFDEEEFENFLSNI